MSKSQRNNSGPEKVFRLSNVSASVFANDIDAESGTRTIRNVSIQRSYLEGDTTKYVTSFGVADLPRVIRVLQLAQNYVEELEVSAM